MKKYLLLFIASATLHFAMAQQSPVFGIRAGVSSSGMRGNTLNSLNNLLTFSNGMVTTGSRTGFFAGAFTTIPIGGVLALEPGVYYTQKGYALNGSLDFKALSFLGVRAKAQLNTQYIDMPILLKANISGFNVYAGPQISYLASANLRTTAGALGFNLLNSSISATSQFNRWDAALTGGIGYTFSNGFNVMAAYDYGLVRVDKNSMTDAYNKAFKVGVSMPLR